MLQAIDNQGKNIIPAACDRDELNRLKVMKQPYFCPECKEPVVLKAGLQVIPHFAHRSAGGCSAGIGEGTYHERGKWLLFNWLAKQGLEVELEAYLPEIGRRPDILLTIGRSRIAVEYQCASISALELSRRMDDYRANGIEQIWILGGNKLKRLGRSVLSVNQFIMHFLHYFENSPNEYLYFFCPETADFATFQNPIFSTKKKAFGSLHIRKLQHLLFTDLFHQADMRVSLLAHYWSGEKKLFRLSAGRRAFEAEHQFRQWLYLNGMHIETLPACVGLPVRNAHFMKMPVFHWQARLVMECIKPSSGKKLAHAGLLRTMQRLRTRSSHGLLQGKRIDPVVQYVDQLRMLGYLKGDEESGYKIGLPIELCRNVEQSMYEDKMLMDEWRRLMDGSNQMRSMNHPNSAIL